MSPVYPSWGYQVKKALASANEKLQRSTSQENPITQFNYNEYMTQSLRIHDVWEPETYAEAAQDPRWVDAMKVEM